MKLIRYFDNALSKVEVLIMSLSLITMLLIATLQFVLRNFFNTGITWADVFTQNLVLWVGFFGATLATKEKRHLSVDALTKFVSEKYHPWIELLVSLFSAVVGYYLFQAAYAFMLDERKAGTILFANVPGWWIISVMPLGFSIITFRYGIFVLESLIKIISPKEIPSH